MENRIRHECHAHQPHWRGTAFVECRSCLNMSLEIGPAWQTFVPTGMHRFIIIIVLNCVFIFIYLILVCCTVCIDQCHAGHVLNFNFDTHDCRCWLAQGIPSCMSSVEGPTSAYVFCF